ncbi:MAG: AAA family ATPase [Patescibacteria group bacterium]|jgi:DNA polymerase-3 subunit delta'
MHANFSQILGHKRQISVLERFIISGAENGVFAFCGPEHIGKSTVAKQFASAFLRVDLNELFRHPDFISLSPEVRENGTRAYDIESIRDVLHRLGQSSISGKAVVIIDDANVLNTASQNALLKMLEEPNAGTVIVLISHEESALLPTIRSRAVTLSFFGVSSAASEDILLNAKRLVSCSGVERLKAAQDIAKQELKDFESLFIALIQELHMSNRASAKGLHAVLKTRERIAANANPLIAFTELAVQLD